MSKTSLAALARLDKDFERLHRFVDDRSSLLTSEEIWFLGAMMARLTALAYVFNARADRVSEVEKAGITELEIALMGDYLGSLCSLGDRLERMWYWLEELEVQGRGLPCDA